MKKRVLSIIFALAMIITSLRVAGITPEISSYAAGYRITLKSGAKVPSEMYCGKKYNLKFNGNKAVTFGSTCSLVAKVGKTSGQVTPVAPGKVTIRARNRKTRELLGSVTIRVLKRSTKVSADEQIILSKPGDTAVINTWLTPDDSSDVVRFSSKDKKIATVESTTGEVKAVGYGTTTIDVIAKAKKSVGNTSKTNKRTTVKVIVGTVLGVPHLDNMTYYKGQTDVKPLDVSGTTIAPPEALKVGKITYQWYKTFPNHMIEQEIPGATESKYIPPTDETADYRCEITYTSNAGQYSKATEYSNYATITIIDKVPVEFDANGGKINGETSVTKEVEWGKSVQFPDAASLVPPSEEYVFLGWADLSSDTEPKYGKDILFTPTIKHKDMFYAIWGIKPAPTPTPYEPPVEPGPSVAPPAQSQTPSAQPTDTPTTSPTST